MNRKFTQKERRRRERMMYQYQSSTKTLKEFNNTLNNQPLTLAEILLDATQRLIRRSHKGL